MTSDRCHACGAAVTPGAPWCTLCYADLRPAPAPAEPMADPVASRRTDPQVLAPDPILDGPGPIPVSAVTASAVVAALAPPAPAPAPAPAPSLDLSWPCGGCGALVPIAEDFCSQCGLPFLPKDAAPSLSLPVVGNLGGLDKTQRVWVMVGGVIVMTAAFFLLTLIFGSVL